MKKLFIISLLTITLLNVGCNKKSSSSSYETSSSTSAKKCPNCGSINTGDYHDNSGNGVDIPGLKVCHTCGTTF
jgi:hypothetical protein